MPDVPWYEPAGNAEVAFATPVLDLESVRSGAEFFRYVGGNTRLWVLDGDELRERAKLLGIDRFVISVVEQCHEYEQIVREGVGDGFRPQDVDAMYGCLEAIEDLARSPEPEVAMYPALAAAVCEGVLTACGILRRNIEECVEVTQL